MKFFEISVLLLVVVNLSEVSAQSGTGEDVSTISFAGKVRLPNEVFSAALDDPATIAYISLKDLFEDDIVDEVNAQLTSESVPFDSITAEVTSFKDGSVIVFFVLIVEGTPISVNDLADVLTTISSDGFIGNFTAEQIQDLDECTETATDCSEFATCANAVGSFSCNCAADFFDESGNGTICVTPVTVLCEASRMEIAITQGYLDSLNINLDDLRLVDENCGGNLTSGEYVFVITDDLSNCGSTRSSNGTHVTYENTLSNEPKSDAIIVTGTNVSIPFSCSYPKNLTTTVSFEGQVSSINISTPGGEGTFEVAFKIYTSEEFTVEETKTEFETTANIFLQAELNSDDSSLAVVLDRCWATPSDAIDDETQVDIITSGCEVSTAISGTVSILRNGQDSRSRFRVQVFRFIDRNTTYVHCSLDVCSTADGNVCEPSCSALGSARKRREIRDQSIVTLSRRRRETPTEQDKTVGPFYRITDTVVDVRFWTVTMTLVLLIIVLLFAVGCLVRKLRSKGRAAVVGLKMKSYAVDNCAYDATSSG